MAHLRRKAGLTLIAVGMLLATLAAPTGNVRAANTNYYVDSINGQDTNSGLSTSQAWRTISRVNSASFGPGDTLQFARGSVWSGTALLLAASGTTTSPITLKTYGSGAAPVLKNPGALHALKITGDYIAVDGLAFQDAATFTTFGRTYEFPIVGRWSLPMGQTT